MTSTEIELFDAHPEWRLVLASYQQQHAAGRLEWSSRIAAVEGIAAEELPTIHGKLIALGLLKFEIADRAEGVRYQVTPLGRQALLPPESRASVCEWALADEAASPAA